MIYLDKCKSYLFIPCLNNQNNKLVKYTDQPYYPHNMNIAHLFADIIPIINLSGIVNNEKYFCIIILFF